MITALRQAISNHGKHRRPGHKALYSLCKVYMMGYCNVDTDSRTNGEFALMQDLVRKGVGGVFFDVGANVGEWTEEALEMFPNTHVHAFEVSPSTYQKLTTNITSPNATLNMFGLSKEAGTFTLHFNVDAPVNSSLHAKAGLNRLEGANVVEETVETRVGDAYCAEHGIERIDFLKIDTEGHDYNVLEGFSKMLAEGRIGRIQFEYNKSAISAGSYLRNFYDLLDKDYVIHRITPAGAIAEEYELFSENFLYSNFFAVHKSLL